MKKGFLKKVMAGAMASMMTFTLVAGFAVSGETVQAEEQEYLYTNFKEITSVNSLTVGQTYMFTTEQYNSTDAFASIPSGGAQLKYAGAGALDQYCANTMSSEFNQGSVDVVESGSGFDGCPRGTIGYGTVEGTDGTITEQDYETYERWLSYEVPSYYETEADFLNDYGYSSKEDFILGLIKYDYIKGGTGWFYACCYGGVSYVGPMYLYTYDSVAYTADDITIVQSSNWKDTYDANGTKTVTKDEITVKVTAGGNTYTIAFYDISSADNTVNNTDDNQITVTIGNITKTVTIAARAVGSVQKDESVVNNNTQAGTMAVGVVSETSDVVAALPEDIQAKINEAVANGNNVALRMNMTQQVVEDLPQTDVDAIASAKGTEFTVGQYVDLSLYMYVTDANGQDISNEKLANLPNGYITVAIVIPEELRPDANTDREFRLVRLHEGEAEATVLEGTYDRDTFTFTFATNKFSTYAIVYKDTEIVTPVTTTSDTSTTETTTEATTTTTSDTSTTVTTAPKTGDNMYVMELFLIGLMILSGTSIVILKKKSE